MIRSLALVLAGLIAGAGLAYVAVARDRDMCLAHLTFLEAVPYAGATDHVFTVQDGADLTLRLEHGRARATGFEPLLIQGDEGPPETNPERAGMPHILCITADGIALRPET